MRLYTALRCVGCTRRRGVQRVYCHVLHCGGFVDFFVEGVAGAHCGVKSRCSCAVHHSLSSISVPALYIADDLSDV